MSSDGRRFLVLVRAGDKSLHRAWLEGGERNWDLVVSWFGNEPYTPVADERVLPAKGWKWDVLGSQLQVHPELVDDYDYIMLPDDDLEMDAARISRLFELTEKYKLAVSQPALTVDSYFSHLQTVVCPSMLLRYVDFVEVMTPILSRETLRRSIPLFNDVPSGFGLGHLWTRYEVDNWYRAAIFDVVTVRHTRPVGQVLARSLAMGGRSSIEEGRALVRRHGLSFQRNRFPAYGGISRDGRPLGRAATVLWMLRDYVMHAPRYIQPRSKARILRMLRYFYRGPALSQVIVQPADTDATEVRASG